MKSGSSNQIAEQNHVAVWPWQTNFSA